MLLTRNMTCEWAKYNIQVNALAPGYMATAATKALRDDAERSETILERIPAGRWGTSSAAHPRERRPRVMISAPSRAVAVLCVTQVLGWPHMAKALVDHPTFAQRDLSSIRAGSMAALLPQHLQADADVPKANSLGMLRRSSSSTI